MIADIDLGFAIRLGRGFKTDAEKASCVLRSKLSIAPHERMPAADLADYLGMCIVGPDRIPGLQDLDMDHLKNSGARKWSAIYLPVPFPYRDLIIHNQSHSLERQEANLFHEIGHQVCGHKPDKIIVINGFPIREFSKEKEDQANYIGQCLHISKDAAFYALKAGLSVDEICAKYCSSREVANLRLNITGVRKIMARSQARWSR